MTLRKEITIVALFYLLTAINYFIVLVIDSGIYNAYKGVLLNHLLKFILSFPIWWLFHRIAPNISRWKTLGIHLILLPVYSLAWTYIYYYICDILGLFHLSGNRRIWDLYLTALFYVTQFGGYHLYIFNKKWREQKKLTSELSTLSTRSELMALKAQLNPHFLYNVFNAVYAAIPKEAKNAREMVTQLSDLFRYQLKASREEMVDLRDELDFVKKYLDLEKQRFGDRLEYNIYVDERLLAEMVPPILIQPIIENAIKHGLASIVAGGRIDLEIIEHQDFLHIKISDTGIGIGSTAQNELLTKGIGLSNTDKRLKKMYGKGIHIRNGDPRGTVVSFTIPLGLNS